MSPPSVLAELRGFILIPVKVKRIFFEKSWSDSSLAGIRPRQGPISALVADILNEIHPTITSRKGTLRFTLSEMGTNREKENLPMAHISELPIPASRLQQISVGMSSCALCGESEPRQCALEDPPYVDLLSRS